MASEIKARIAAGDRAADKAADHFRAAGLRLLDAKAAVAAAGLKFNGWLIENDIGRSRAYELIGIAKGTKTLAGIRASTADRVARHARKGREAKESASNGLALPDQDSALIHEVEWLRSEVERLTEENTALKDRVEVSALEVACLRLENDRLRGDEEAGADWVVASDSERSADEIIRTEYAIEFRQTMVFENYGDEPEAQQAKRVLSYVDFQAAGSLLGRSAAKNVIKMIRERKRADKQPPDKAALAALRKRAQALGYKTIHRRGNDYWIVNADGERTQGGTGLDLMAQLLDDEEAFRAGAVRVYSTHCGKPVSAHDINGEVALDDPRAVEAFARFAGGAQAAQAA